MYQAKDLMTSDVIAVSPDASIDEAVTLLLDHQVSGLPVVDGSGKLLGVISEIDIIDLVYKFDIETSHVSDHMTRNVCTIDLNASLDEAASIFCEHRIRRIPVVDKGRLVGVLARRDLIRFVRDVLQRGGTPQPNRAPQAST